MGCPKRPILAAPYACNNHPKEPAMRPYHLMIFIALVVTILASPGESDIKICMDSGQSRETCISALLPGA